MKVAAWSLLLLVMRIQAEGQATTTPSESFLLRTSEWHMTLKPTAGPNNVGNCMIVYPSGRLHLELRRQEFFYGPASFVSYEGTLSNQQLTELRSILDSAAVNTLQLVTWPTGGIHSQDFQWFTAEIQRPTKTQRVGTYSLNIADAKNSENDERASREAGIALQPLIDWSHRVKSSGPPELRIVPNSDSVCGQ
jgi:hypothetical protein